MKKFLAIALAAIVAVMPLAARDRVSRTATDLPTAAQTMLNKYFKGVNVSHIKIDSGLFSTDYDVVLTDGTEIDFDSDGQWTEVDCGRKAVPEALVDKNIRYYVSKNYAGSPIVKISADRRKYEVELLNGVDLEFDRSGRFLRVDD